MATDNMGERLERVETAVSGLEQKVMTLDQRLTALDQKVTNLDQKVDNYANENKIQFENIREDIKKLGEGHESGLKAISRQIKNLDKRWAEKWSMHDLAIRDHGKRITALEGRPRR